MRELLSQREGIKSHANGHMDAPACSALSCDLKTDRYLLSFLYTLSCTQALFDSNSCISLWRGYLNQKSVREHYYIFLLGFKRDRGRRLDSWSRDRTIIGGLFCFLYYLRGSCHSCNQSLIVFGPFFFFFFFSFLFHELLRFGYFVSW
jgi:hypothetical protein